MSYSICPLTTKSLLPFNSDILYAIMLINCTTIMKIFTVTGFVLVVLKHASSEKAREKDIVNKVHHLKIETLIIFYNKHGCVCMHAYASLGNILI